METSKEANKEMSKESKKESFFQKAWVQSVTGVLVIVLVAGTVLFYKSSSSSISIDQSIVSAPVINIGPQAGGTLEEVYVKEGDNVTAGQALARVDGEILSAKVGGIVISVTDTPGQVFQPTQPVIQMIQPEQLRIVGTIKENDGFADIAVGDPVSFTVDAFGGKTYVGVVDSISPTSKESGVAFSISDKREVKEFDIKVKYDVSQYPEFKNGMSAKMHVYKQVVQK